MHPIRHSTSACLAAAFASVMTGSASAAAQFTTLHSATFSLSSLNGSSVSSSATFTGPTSDTGGSVSMGAMTLPNTGNATVDIGGIGSFDKLYMDWRAPGGSATYDFQMTWDVTFNSSQGGGVNLALAFMNSGSLSAIPNGGSAAALAMGDFLANGRYTISWVASAPSVNSGVTGQLWFSEAANGGGVPLPGAAGLAAAGLVGLSRRRKR